MKNKRQIKYIISTILLLLIPLIAMQFTNQVNWTPSDFIVAAILLLSTGFAIDFVIKKVQAKKYRITLSAIIVVMFLLVWAELAVGIFGTPLSGS